MSDISFIKGVGVWIVFTDSNETDLSTKTCSFTVKKTEKSPTALIEKEDGDFNKAEATDGIVKVNLTATDTNLLSDSVYVGELKIILTASTDVFIEKIRIIVKPTVF